MAKKKNKNRNSVEKNEGVVASAPETTHRTIHAKKETGDARSVIVDRDRVEASGYFSAMMGGLNEAKEIMDGMMKEVTRTKAVKIEISLIDVEPKEESNDEETNADATDVNGGADTAAPDAHTADDVEEVNDPFGDVERDDTDDDEENFDTDEDESK